MTTVARRMVEAPRRTAAAALIVLFSIGSTVALTLAAQRAGDEASLRRQLTAERAQRVALMRRAARSTERLVTLQQSVDRAAQALRLQRRQRDAARRAQRAAAARLSALRTRLRELSETLGRVRRQRAIARRAQLRAERRVAREKQTP